MRNEFDLRTEKLMAREEARAEGLAEGRAEGQREIAKKMLSDGVGIEVISKYTNLPVGEIRELLPTS